MLRQASRSSLPSDLPAIVELGEPRAADPAVSGAKAASLTAAKRAGLPVLPGFVITAPAAASILEQRARTRLEGSLEAAIRSAWLRLSADESRAVIVRSSSLIEDSGTSSMAGMFASVSSVRSWAAFLDAVDAVLASSQTVAVRTGQSAPIAVLVQPQLEAEIGGGDVRVRPTHRPAGPAAGLRRPRHAREARSRRGRRRPLPAYEKRSSRRANRHGRRDPDQEAAEGLAALATRAAETFRRPQDVEWGIGADGALWLLQSRPITAAGEDAKPRGPVKRWGPRHSRGGWSCGKCLFTCRPRLKIL